jgi:hypothetical protein
VRDRSSGVDISEAQEARRTMNTLIHVDDQCSTVADVAERLRVKPDTVRRLFMNEPGVIVISAPRKGRRVYRTQRIPVSVYQRVVTRLMRVA